MFTLAFQFCSMPIDSKKQDKSPQCSVESQVEEIERTKMNHTSRLLYDKCSAIVKEKNDFLILIYAS